MRVKWRIMTLCFQNVRVVQGVALLRVKLRVVEGASEGAARAA